LLWEPVREAAEAMIAGGSDPVAAWASASTRIMSEQAKRVAIPRRFGSSIEEIWILQPRFEQRVKKRVHRLLAHPRFRAAYDFLLLRSSESPALTELAEWWTAAQQMDAPELAKALTADTTATGSGDAGEPVKKRRRPRRRRRKTTPAEGAAPDA
jgi:poly(A) polymerase